MSCAFLFLTAGIRIPAVRAGTDAAKVNNGTTRHKPYELGGIHWVQSSERSPSRDVLPGHLPDQAAAPLPISPYCSFVLFFDKLA